MLNNYAAMIMHDLQVLTFLIFTTFPFLLHWFLYLIFSWDACSCDKQMTMFQLTLRDKMKGLSDC